jgi:MFS family permease
MAASTEPGQQSYPEQSTDPGPPVNGASTAQRNVPSIVRSLRHRNYQLFFGGQLISLVGTWMQSVAQSWLVYRLTKSGLLLGGVGFAGQIPAFLIGPLAGTIVDRHNKHRIVIATQVSSMLLACILAALTLTNTIQVWHIFVLAALLGVVNGFDIPGRQSFIVEMVGREDLINAIALNSSMFNGARIVGPAVAGVLVAIIGEGWCFFANAVSFIAVIAGLLLMKNLPHGKAPRTGSTVDDIVEGFRFVGTTSPIRELMLMLALVSLMGMPYSVLMPIFAAEVLHGGASALGFLMCCAGLGALIGALSLAARREVRGLGRWVAYAATGFGVSLILFSLSRNLYLSALLLVPAGFCIMVQMAASNTLIQTMSPDRLRGRVMSVYAMTFMGMAPLGSLIAGALAGRISAPVTVAVGGAVCIAGGLVFLSRLPALKVHAERLIVASEMVGGDPADEMTVGSSIAVK